MGGVDAGADEGAPGVHARVPGHGDVRGVVGVDVHRVGDGVGPGQLHQAGDHAIVVGAAVVLGADGHLALGAAQIVPHAAHVHRQQLVHLGQGGPSVAHLLMDGEAHLGIVPGPLPGDVHQPQQSEQTGCAPFVVDKPGLEEAAVGDHGLGVDAHEVAGGDAQGLHAGPVLHHLVDAHGQVLLVPRAGEHVVKDVGRRGQRQDGSGVYPAVPGVDAAVLPVQGGQDGPADSGGHQHAVGGDGAHHEAQGVDVGAQADALPLFPAGHRHHQVSLVGAADGVAVVPGDLLRLPHYLVRKAAGAVNGQKPLGNVHELPPASLCIQHLHRLLVCSMI